MSYPFMMDGGLNRILFDDQTGEISPVTREEAEKNISQLIEPYIEPELYQETREADITLSVRYDDVEPFIEEFMGSVERDINNLFTRQPSQDNQLSPKEPSIEGSDILADFYNKLTEGLLHLPKGTVSDTTIEMKDRGSTFLDTFKNNLLLLGVIIIGAIAIMKD